MRAYSKVLVVFNLILGSALVQAAETVERIVAIVNDDIITLSDIGMFAERLKAGGLVDPTLVPDEDTKKDLLTKGERLLQKLVDSKLLDTEVKRQNLSVTIEKVEQEIRNIAKKNNMGRDDLKSALRSQGVSFAQYQDFIKTSLERQSLIGKAVVSKIKVSEEDVLAALAANHADQKPAFEFTLSQIYFSNDKGGTSAARSRAETVLSKLKGGLSFDKLAADHSEDPGFEQGGLLGVFKTGELSKELENAVTPLEAAGFTGVLPTRGGFHIVRLVSKKVIADPRWERERDRVRAQLYDKAFQRQLTAFLDQLRQDAFIRINK